MSAVDTAPGAAAGEEGPAGDGGEGGARGLTAAQRARAERQRLRARELRAAAKPDKYCRDEKESGPRAIVSGGEKLLDTGGGFLLPASEAPRAAPAPAPALPAPPPRRADWPACVQCGARFPSSYLLDKFSWAACDACREHEQHELLTRTEAKELFLLKDCDLDLRPPPLPCERRRNPHHRAGDMRLYLRAQLQARAHEVWGGEAGLAAARGERERRREGARGKRYAAELRALRMEARGSLYAAARAGHEHRWGAEAPAPAAGDDMYQRTCLDCDHTQLYEKM
ncbi:DNA repair protein complementing XP-A cells homolog [Plutella xylostella]|uniref:DNA repair protein complementing XP-A cells homolog n=1 Tax=Plutella xylostella TaxID=51655 RepID=UPI002032BD16|nr:DNA repair protein complementing XP-A cells homolog [Plutella xylostella]